MKIPIRNLAGQSGFSHLGLRPKDTTQMMSTSSDSLRPGHALLFSSALLALAGQPAAQGPDRLQWGVREAEHLLNRAAFGARTAEVEHWAAAGPEALVEHLFRPSADTVPFYFEPFEPPADAEQMDAGRGNPLRRLGLVHQKRQLAGFVNWWIEEMLSGDAPLRERMTLFWHGFFPSASSKVKRSRLLIDQNEFLRAGALGSYGDLLTGILQDPAMILYLDNQSNKRGSPNENLAREAMELFSLGEGNYTERDVSEAARALTGGSVGPGGEYRFRARQHDRGEKQILGSAGRHGPASFARVLLEQEACAEFVAGELITYFEGVAPSPERLTQYAALLRGEDYRIEPFLRRLFLDPDFYRAEIVGARVLAPVEFLVSSARRLGIEPPAAFLSVLATELGQKLLDPPSVKGWDEGFAWVSTSSMMLRANGMGILLGVIDPAEFFRASGPPNPGSGSESAEDGMMDGAAAAGEMPGEMEGEMAGEMAGEDKRGTPPAAPRSRAELGGFGRALRILDRIGYRPRLNLTHSLARRGPAGDRALVECLADELLGVAATPAALDSLTTFLTAEREALGFSETELLESADQCEQLLRRLAHLILALPEAQTS